MRFIVVFIATFLCINQPALLIAGETKVVKAQSKRGVTQPFLFVVPDKPKAGVVLFVGGDGVLKLSDYGKISGNKNNFFVRTYRKFAEQGLMVALVDIPSDKKKGALFRLSKNHAQDISAVIKVMTKKADVPIWLVGTSMGSLSAASVGLKKQAKVAGMVLTASVSRPGKGKGLKKLTAKYPDGVAGLNLQKFKKPALIVSHTEDSCKVSPPADAAKIKAKLSNSPRVEVVLLEGGKDTKSDVCKGLSRHGFFGIEDKAVKKIVNFIAR